MIVEISSTHCESEKSERIEKNQSCPTIRISHKQLLAKNFAGVESGLNHCRFPYCIPRIERDVGTVLYEMAYALLGLGFIESSNVLGD